ncbi:MAG: hypothetical protein RIR00_1134, partial [Pseudomonadota bacterium]
MWHKPQLLNALSDLLFVAGLAAYLAAAALWLQRQPLLPLQQVVFVAPSQHLLREDMATALAPQLKGNFISLNLDAIRATLELQPWVRRAEVRRAWPASLEVRIEEQKPAARWGDNPNDLVNTYGELFKASLPDDEA